MTGEDGPPWPQPPRRPPVGGYCPQLEFPHMCTIQVKYCIGAEEKTRGTRHLAAAPAPRGPRGSGSVASGLPWLRPPSTVAKIAFEFPIHHGIAVDAFGGDLLVASAL